MKFVKLLKLLTKSQRLGELTMAAVSRDPNYGKIVTTASIENL